MREYYTLYILPLPIYISSQEGDGVSPAGAYSCQYGALNVNRDAKRPFF
jgi:hypothetical protein